MDTNAESPMQNKVIEYVKQYAMITLSISIMSVGVYFFKFPNNFVFGGVTGMAALAAKLTPLSASAFSSAANMILLGVGLLGAPAMLRLLNTKEDLLPGAILYLRVYFLGMPAMALYNFGNAVFSAIGETKKPLYILSFAGVLNILLNLFFVIVCNLDVAGVALASAISQCVSAGLILHALTRVQDCYALHFKEA